MPGTIALCNMACAEIAADPIASLDEASVSARECKRVFDQCLAELLEWSDWWFATRRVLLAGVPNDRPVEWRAAFALPADLASAVALHRHDSIAMAVPDDEQVALAIGGGVSLPFLIDGGTLYANVDPAVLEYTVSQLSPEALPALVARALALEIAARIAYPVKKDRGLANDLLRKAELARARAIADNENISPREDRGYVSVVEQVRAGWAG